MPEPTCRSPDPSFEGGLANLYQHFWTTRAPHHAHFVTLGHTTRVQVSDATWTMGKAYSEDQRAHVRTLLETGRDEESIEKETGVSDRTIRRWKLELERTGRIGKVGHVCCTCICQI